MVIDGCTMFNCEHQWLMVAEGLTEHLAPGRGDGVLCHKCGHFRDTIPMKTPKQLHFFPSATSLVLEASTG